MEYLVTQLNKDRLAIFQSCISSFYYQIFSSRYCLQVKKDYQMSYHLLSFSCYGKMKIEEKMTLTNENKDQWLSLNEELTMHTNLLQDFTSLPRDVLFLVMEFAAPGNIFSFCLWVDKRNGVYK